MTEFKILQIILGYIGPERYGLMAYILRRDDSLTVEEARDKAKEIVEWLDAKMVEANRGELTTA